MPNARDAVSSVMDLPGEHFMQHLLAAHQAEDAFTPEPEDVDDVPAETKA